MTNGNDETIETTDELLRTVLESETIAVVGCSATPGKAAHEIPAYMQDHGYTIVPVNPFAEEILGQDCYDSLEEVEEAIDLVDVFRPSDEVAGITESVLDRDDIGAVWLQLGIRDDESGRRIKETGRRFVQDRCLKVEHQRLAD